MPDYPFITMLVGVISLLVAVITLTMSRKKQNDEEAKYDATVGTKLDFIGSDIKDIKADQRVIQRDLNEVRNIAIYARERADSTNDRLDRLHGNEE